MTDAIMTVYNFFYQLFYSLSIGTIGSSGALSFRAFVGKLLDSLVNAFRSADPVDKFEQWFVSGENFSNMFAVPLATICSVGLAFLVYWILYRVFKYLCRNVCWQLWRK